MIWHCWTIAILEPPNYDVVPEAWSSQTLWTALKRFIPRRWGHFTAKKVYWENRVYLSIICLQFVYSMLSMLIVCFWVYFFLIFFRVSSCFIFDMAFSTTAFESAKTACVQSTDKGQEWSVAVHTWGKDISKPNHVCGKQFSVFLFLCCHCNRTDVRTELRCNFPSVKEMIEAAMPTRSNRSSTNELKWTLWFGKAYCEGVAYVGKTWENSSVPWFWG